MKFSADEKWVTEIYGLQTLEHPNLLNVLVAFIYGKGAEQVEYKSLNEAKYGIQKLMDQIFNLNFKVSEIKSIERYVKWNHLKYPNYRQTINQNFLILLHLINSNDYRLKQSTVVSITGAYYLSHCQFVIFELFKEYISVGTCI